jgi:lysophospholipase-2
MSYPMPSPESAFPEPVIFDPTTAPHTHTVILIHGRGSSGAEFSTDIFDAELSMSASANKAQNLRTRFPSFRWIFPSARTTWTSAFEEARPSWFDAYSLTDISAKSELQIPGLNESVRYIRQLLDAEVQALGGDSKKVILGGMSQGCAISLWTLLSEKRELGGLIAANGWMPFQHDVVRYTDGERAKEGDVGLAFVESMISQAQQTSNGTTLSKHTPVLHGHGTDDGWVGFEIGKSARNTLIKIGYSVDWKDYSGAEMEGHWIKEPEQFDDIAAFLEKVQQHT